MCVCVCVCVCVCLSVCLSVHLSVSVSVCLLFGSSSSSWDGRGEGVTGGGIAGREGCKPSSALLTEVTIKTLFIEKWPHTLINCNKRSREDNQRHAPSPPPRSDRPYPESTTSQPHIVSWEKVLVFQSIAYLFTVSRGNPAAS